MHNHHLSVRARAYSRGIAYEPMRQVEAEALAEGSTSITLDTWAANEPARSFFTARGFTSFNLTLDKRQT